MARLLFVIGLLAACDPPAAPPPPETELVLDDEGARVRVTLVDGGGLTDRVVDYDVTIEMGGVTRSVLHGTAQAQSVAHRTRAHRLGAMIAIALGDALCLVDAAGAPLCLDLSEVDPDTSAVGPFADAIAWRAGDALGDDRAAAAIALAWVDPPRGLVAVRATDGVSDERRAELDATDARLTADPRRAAGLREGLGERPAAEVLAIARACVPALRADLEAERARLPAFAQPELDAALARCAP